MGSSKVIMSFRRRANWLPPVALVKHGKTAPSKGGNQQQREADEHVAAVEPNKWM